MAKKAKKQQQLTNKAARHLRGLGHHLAILAMIGREGMSKTLIQSVNEVLAAHELVKVRVQNNCPHDKKEAAELLAEVTGAAVVQVLGKTILLFRENAELDPEKRIKLPA